MSHPRGQDDTRLSPRRSPHRFHMTAVSFSLTRSARATAVHRATGPNQVWSWDITWLPTVVRGRYHYLYLVMDVWSRRIVGWQVLLSDNYISPLATITSPRPSRA